MEKFSIVIASKCERLKPFMCDVYGDIMHMKYSLMRLMDDGEIAFIRWTDESDSEHIAIGNKANGEVTIEYKHA